MKLGQFITLGFMAIWVWVVAGIALVQLGPEGSNSLSQLAIDVGGRALLVSAPVFFGIAVWRWLGDRSRTIRSYLLLGSGPLFLAIIGSIATAFVSGEGESRSECGWAITLSVEDPLGGNVTGVPVLEDLQFTVGQFVFQQLYITGRVRNPTRGTYETISYYVGFLDAESQVIGEQTGIQRAMLRPGFADDFSISVDRDNLSDIARTDTARVWVRYCQVAAAPSHGGAPRDQVLVEPLRPVDLSPVPVNPGR